MTEKMGGYTCVAEGRMLLSTPPQGVFGTLPKLVGKMTFTKSNYLPYTFKGDFTVQPSLAKWSWPIFNFRANKKWYKMQNLLSFVMRKPKRRNNYFILENSAKQVSYPLNTLLN